MNQDWYKSADGVRKAFEAAGQLEELERKLLGEGILFEGDFGGLVTSNLIEHGKNALKKVFQDRYEYYVIDSSDVDYFGHTDVDLGWCYFLYDTKKMSFEEARNRAQKRFH